eukprot:3769314-Amphidinium_carterae.1
MAVYVGGVLWGPNFGASEGCCRSAAMHGAGVQEGRPGFLRAGSGTQRCMLSDHKRQAVRPRLAGLAHLATR